MIYHRSVARWGRMIGLVVAALLGGCLPQSHEPIAPASEAIVEPRLAGTVDHDLSGPSVTLTDSAAHIRDFLATASPRGLFDETIELRRLDQPPA